MTTPIVLNSSPPRTQHVQIHVGSSSPDLPPLQHFISQRLTRSSTRNGSKAAPIPDDAPTGFTLARHLWQSAATDRETGNVEIIEDRPAQDIREAAAPVSVIEISPQPSPKQLKPRARSTTTKRTSRPRQKATASKTQDLEPTNTENRDQTDQNEQVVGKTVGKTVAKPKFPITRKVKKTAPANEKATPTTEADAFLDPPKTDIHEPLHLEQAPARRRDWTPPAQKTVVNLDADSSAYKQLCSAEDAQSVSNLKSLLESYTCSDVEPSAISVNSEDDSSLLRKRKRIELSTTKDTNAPITAPQKPPKKALKKKPRTITEMATRAYKLQTQPEPNLDPPTASILDHFQSVAGKTEASETEQQPKAKGKATRKRVTKVTKKKAVPPKAILLSPGTALAQVAKQDFVFGTSSQLAREDSPTVLRDLQTALRRSNQTSDLDFATPINSDAIEPPERRAKLWDAGARDAEGDLFDIDIINLVEASPKLREDADDADPFGYSNVDNRIADLALSSEKAPDNPASVSLPDILTSPGAEKKDKGSISPFFSNSDISTSTNVGGNSKRDGTESLRPENETARPIQEVTANQLPPPKRPEFERYTDARLAKEIKSFGFKAIKRRSAMIALLDQCWQSKVQMGHANVHTSSRQSAAAAQSSNSPPAPITKRPRGRPRKNSANAPGPQEPPPSAQPPETPKRRRGRPRKDSLSPSLPPKPHSAKTTPTSAKTASSSKSARNQKAPAGLVVEIPDSASDIECENIECEIASTPDSTIEEMFSSPPLDMSLATEDTQASLSASQNDTEEVIFEYITKAVRSAPRTTDPQQPSWHEKILLYDPIVLEDLTTWLNTGELGRVGFDNEVSPADVKKWCELKSICCLWKVNLRGKERKRF